MHNNVLGNILRKSCTLEPQNYKMELKVTAIQMAKENRENTLGPPAGKRGDNKEHPSPF